MKKVLFFTLFLLILGAANMNAQVAIGADEPPHPGAVLDLKSYSLGLKLPVVAIWDAKVFQLPTDGSDATGMLVYNPYNATVDGRGPGLYYWDGNQWQFVGVSGPVQTPVTGITVSSYQNATTVTTGYDLLFTAVVMPSNATNPMVQWSVIPGTGTGSIDPVSGLFTGGAPGTATIRATATDGSYVYGEKPITVSPGTVPVTGITDITGGNSMQAPGTLQLAATVVPSNATNTLVVWSIVSGTGATVDQSGNVTATAAGTVVVRASADANPAIYKEISVSITAIVPSRDCTGCKQLLDMMGESKETYPGAQYYPNQCSALGTGMEANNDACVRYRWTGTEWVFYSRAPMTNTNWGPANCGIR